MTIQFTGSIKQFTPKKLVSGDHSLRLLIEVSSPNQELLQSISNVFLSQSNLTETAKITLES